MARSRVAKLFYLAAGATIVGATYEAYKKRPVASPIFAYAGHPDRNVLQVRSHPAQFANIDPRFNTNQDAVPKPSLLQHIANVVVITTVQAISRGWINYFNSIEMYETEKLTKFVLNRPPGVPLISVSNHSSVFDDPIVVSNMLPYSVATRPQLMRWGICSQEICFFNDYAGTFFGAGKVMPVQRGAGVMQKELGEFSKQVEDGAWVHVYPEGRVVQGGKMGPFRWGIGRVLAHCKDSPIIVPFYHTGMDKMMPQNEKNELLSFMPTTGNHIRVLVGDPIRIDDLMARHRREKMKEFAEHPEYGRWDLENFSPADQRFYRDVTERIRVALLKLEKELAEIPSTKETKKEEASSNKLQENMIMEKKE